MTTKYLNFFTMAWFISTLICMVLEGSFFSSSELSIVNDLSNPITSLKVAGLIPIPAFNLYFFRGLYRILVWNYSFYTGGWEILRWFWLVTLSPGVIWGVGSTFAPIFANMLRIFR